METTHFKQKAESAKLAQEALQYRQEKNARIESMLEKCSDEKAILIAESIAAHRLAGLDTSSLDKTLSSELTRMMASTKMFFGRLPQLHMIKD